MQWIFGVALAGRYCWKVADGLFHCNWLAYMRFGDHGDRPQLGGKQYVATSLLGQAVIHAMNGVSQT